MTPLAPGTDAQREPVGAWESFMLELSVNYREQAGLTDAISDEPGCEKPTLSGRQVRHLNRQSPDTMRETTREKKVNERRFQKSTY